MTDSAVAPQASDQYVQSLARGLAVIRAFDANNPVMTLSEVAARTDLTRATARRFLYTWWSSATSAPTAGRSR